MKRMKTVALDLFFCFLIHLLEQQQVKKMEIRVIPY